MSETLHYNDLLEEVKANCDPVDYELMGSHQDRLMEFYAVMVNDPAVPREDLQQIKAVIIALESALIKEYWRKSQEKGDEFEAKYTAALRKALQAKKNEQLLYDLPQDDPGH